MTSRSRFWVVTCLAGAGALLVVLNLLALPWWEGGDTFLDTRGEWIPDTLGWADTPTRDLALAFFRFGFVVFIVAAVATTLLLRYRRAAAVGAVCCLLATIWFILFWNSIGVINTNALAYLGFVGGFAVTAAALWAALAPISTSSDIDPRTRTSE